MRSNDLILPGLVVLLVAAVAWAFLAKPANPVDRPSERIDVPDIAIRTGDKTVSLSQLKGKVVLVDFWATWCGPCAMSIPAIESLYLKYRSRGFEVIGVSVDDDRTAGRVAAFIREMGMTYPAGRVVSVRMVREYGASSIPFMVLVDRKGKGRYVQPGFSDRMEGELAARIEALLKE